MIKIVGLTSNFEWLPVCAANALQTAERIVLQSDRIPIAREIIARRKEGSVETLDDLFMTETDFDALYAAGAQRVEQSAQKGETVFCVIGGFAENGFLRELQKTRQLCFVNPGDGVENAMFAARGCLGEMGEYKVLEARGLGQRHIDTSLALVVRGVDDRYTAAEVKLALSEYYGEETAAAVVCDGTATLEPLYQIDRREFFGAGATVVVAAVALTDKKRYGFYDLVEIMKVLRGENGCPWDKEQTHKTLRQYILEEAYETVDAVDADDMNALYDELGDVLLQIVFHAEIARQCGEFNDMDVTSAVCAKMVHRHPHIFGTAAVKTADDVVVNWEKIKRREKGNEDFVSVLRDVPKSMGAMMRAYKLQKKAGAIGFDWEDARQAMEKVREEMAEMECELLSGDEGALEREAGDLLFAVINVLRKSRANPEVALSTTCEKFIARFAYMEQNAGRELAELSLAQMDQLWNDAKEAGY